MQYIFVIKIKLCILYPYIVFQQVFHFLQIERCFWLTFDISFRCSFQKFTDICFVKKKIFFFAAFYRDGIILTGISFLLPIAAISNVNMPPPIPATWLINKIFRIVFFVFTLLYPIYISLLSDSSTMLSD